VARQRKDVKQVRQVALDVFGYERFRPGQEAAIKAVLDGHDTLAVMPTGSGKSAIYQLAGLQVPGATVVISPLIALQRDQVEAIEQQDGAGGAVLLNSTLRAADRRETFENLEAGEVEFLFLAPEQFNRPEVFEMLQQIKPSLFVVDEAHCISEWGHDFRPDYLKLGAVIEALGHPRVLALTATASPPVRNEIVERLGMRDPKIVVQGFDRPNIWLSVQQFGDEGAKRRALLEHVAKAEKPGIIYAATRKRAEELAEDLSNQGLRAAFYHAGLKPEEREQTQNAFMNDELEVIVATTAFGMGIDKANVRFVYHYDISDSLDSYYQEVGRAGRDGAPAEAILFYRAENLGIRRFFAGSGQVDVDQIQRLALILQMAGGPVTIRQLCEKTNFSQSQVVAALTRLEEVGAIQFLPTGEVIAREELPDLAGAVEEAAQAQERHYNLKRSRVEMMRNYAEVRDCRREFILNYFGEEFDGSCGMCDNCEAGRTIERDESSEPFPINSRVSHRAWGEGTVVRYEGDKMVVLFDRVGYKNLCIEIVLEQQLLAQAA
jgi:ATP-dependent DNA helicase RecQ